MNTTPAQFSPSPSGPAASQPSEGSVRHSGSASAFLSRRLIIATWVASLLVHLVVFWGMFLVPWLSDLFDDRNNQPVAITEIIGDVRATAFTPSTGVDLARVPSPTADALEVQPRPFTDLENLTTPTRADLQIVGIGAGGGDLDTFGLSTSEGRGPEFFGVGSSAAEAKAIVYVVDRSGSMLETFDGVKKELRRSISGLRRTQKFHVIFFSSTPLENPPKRLVSAIRAQKDAFFEFLAGVRPEGGTHPEPAMQRAFALNPDLIYFLTDGMFDPGLLNRLERWNSTRRVRICTIAYVDRSGGALLEKIAREHGGEYRFVSEDELYD